VFIEVSTASSIEYGRGISAGNYKQNTTFTINPNFNMIKNKPKEKNMAEFGWGNVEDLGKLITLYINYFICFNDKHINTYFE